MCVVLVPKSIPRYPDGGNSFSPMGGDGDTRASEGGVTDD